MYEVALFCKLHSGSRFTVHVSNALPFDYSEHTPLCLYGWPHETTSAALARNRAGVAKFAGMLLGANPRVREYAKRLGLRVDWENPGSTISKLAWLTQTERVRFRKFSLAFTVSLYWSIPRWDGPGGG